MRISNFSIKRPVFTFVTMFLVLILGIVSLTRIPLKLIPDINAPVAVVVTTYPGAGPQEVLDKVTKPLEQNLATVPGLKNITSTSQESANFILLEFSMDTDVDEIQSDVLQRIDQTYLPEDVKPRFMKFDPAQFPIIQLSLSGEEDEDVLQELAEDLELELTRVEGVASVTVTGSMLQDVIISLDQEQLQQYGLSQSDIVNVISANNISLPGDTVLTGEKELTTRVISSINSVDILKDLVVTINPTNGEQVTIQDIADITLEKQDTGSITRTNESPSVLMSALQKSDANTAQVSGAFQDVLNDLLEEDKYANIEADVLFDQGDYINLVINNIFRSLIIGGVLAMLVLLFFLRGIKSPIIVGIAIPYSVIVTFVLMYFADFSLNIMTLGGLALGIGMLVDNSIVVIENIYRHLSMGKDPKQAARDGVKQVGGAIFASTLTTIAVFVPVVFISGMIGDLMMEFSLTIAFSLLSSLFVAVTVVPMLASKMLKEPKANVEDKRQNSSLLRIVENMVKWCLGHRAIVLTLLVLLVGGSLFGLRIVGTQFIPPTDEGYFTIQVELENGTALTETEKVVDAIEAELEDEVVVDVYVSLIGSTQTQSAQGGSSQANTAEVFVKLKPLADRDVSIFDFAEEKEKELERAVAKVNKSAEVNVQMQASTGTSPNTLTFNVMDTDSKRLESTVDQIYNELIEMDNVVELTTSLTDTVEEIQIDIDRDEALLHGLMPAQIAMLVNDVTRGVTATTMVDDNNNVMAVKVEYDEDVTRNIDELDNLIIRKNDGTYITLGEVTSIKRGESPVNIQRLNQQNAIQFSLKYSTDTTLGEITQAVDETLADLDLPDEVEISYSGEQEMMESALNDLMLAFILAIVLVYIVMAAQFESFKFPFVIMFTVPLMIIGVSIGLLATDTPVSVMAMIGIIVLAGIVVNNAIVIIDYILKLKEEGLSSYDAIIQAVKDRMRPVLMTALTTILGLVPLAIGIGEGAEMNRPMGITVIAGLISSTFLTLFIIPVIYSLFDKETRHLNRKYRLADGQLIPAYLLDEKIIKPDENEKMDSQPPATTKQNYSKDDMVFMLEHLANLLKDDNTKKDDDSSERE